MKKESSYRITFWALIGVLMLLAILLLTSCEKQEQLTGMDHPNDHQDKVVFLLGCGNARYRIAAEGWPTVSEPYCDDTLYMDSYIKNGEEWYCIYYRRFTAHIWDDHELRYIGWGTVQDTNYVDTEHLNPEFIDLKPTK